MTYLTRVAINPQRHQARRLLTDPRAMKSAVYSSIPAASVQERLLWRVDHDEPHRPWLYLVSKTHPSCEHIVEQAGWPSSPDPQIVTRDYTPLLARLTTGDRYAFRLTANPTRAIKDPRADGTVKRMRVEHRTVPAQTRWLIERAQQHGFRVVDASATQPDGTPAPDLSVHARDRRRFNHQSAGRATIYAVTYQGRLEVTDAEPLRAGLVNGIGRAKAYGCGLLTLAPDTPQTVM